MIAYKLVKDLDGNICAVNRNDGWSIPFDEANTDYQAYLAWLEESPDNKPLPADN